FFLHLAAGAAALPTAQMRKILSVALVFLAASIASALAQAYPSRPVRIIVGLAPGGANDIVARLMGQWLSERLRQQFVIENRPGAGNNIATEVVVRAPPDGHTLLVVGATNNAGLADPKLKARLADLGGTPMPMTPTDFGKFIADKTEKWGKVVRAANIKPE